jgi:hypothetical protein
MMDERLNNRKLVRALFQASSLTNSYKKKEPHVAQHRSTYFVTLDKDSCPVHQDILGTKSSMHLANCHVKTCLDELFCSLQEHPLALSTHLLVIRSC